MIPSSTLSKSSTGSETRPDTKLNNFICVCKNTGQTKNDCEKQCEKIKTQTDNFCTESQRSEPLDVVVQAAPM